VKDDGLLEHITLCSDEQAVSKRTVTFVMFEKARRAFLLVFTQPEHSTNCAPEVPHCAWEGKLAALSPPEEQRKTWMAPVSQRERNPPPKKPKIGGAEGGRGDSRKIDRAVVVQCRDGRPRHGACGLVRLEGSLCLRTGNPRRLQSKDSGEDRVEKRERSHEGAQHGRKKINSCAAELGREFKKS
jgi:hypothetical protein